MFGPGERVVIGGFCIHLVLGTLYCWASITPAITAYLRGYDDSLTYHDTLLVYAAALGTQGIFMLIGGLLETKLGPRTTIIIGGGVIVAGTFLAATCTSLNNFIFADGVMFGMGMGITYTAPITCAIKWLPQKKGMVTGTIVAGFGGGALIFNQIASAILNPHNEKPDLSLPSGLYFRSDSSVAHRVPFCFTILGIIYTMLFVTGVLLTRNPTQDEQPLIPVARSRQRKPINYSNVNAQEQRQDQESNTSDKIYDDSQLQMTMTPIGDRRASVIVGPVLTPIPQKTIKDPESAPLDIIQSSLTWHLAICFFLTTTGGMFFAGTFKTYGLNYIENDVLLTNLATLASAFNACGRIGWGMLGDRLGHSTTLFFMAIGFGLIQLTYPLSVSFGTMGFCIWTLLLFTFEGANFCLYVPLIVILYGTKNSAANYGLVFTVYSIFNVSSIATLSALKVDFNAAAWYCGILCFIGAGNVVWLARRANFDMRLFNACSKKVAFLMVDLEDTDQP